MYRFKYFQRLLHYPHLCFNTSYVSVQVYYSGNIYKKIEFQYILCIGSSLCSNCIRLCTIPFQYILCIGSSNVWKAYLFGYWVSIHPMYRFKDDRRLGYERRGKVSIHPMYRFKRVPVMGLTGNTTFQYILCIGSRDTARGVI